jgi:hypothetical protein
MCVLFVNNVPWGRPRGQISVVCQNPKCVRYLKEKNKYITKAGKCYTTNHQRCHCYHCNTYFMETKGTPPLSKTPNRAANNQYMYKHLRKKRQTKHRATNRSPPRRHRQPPRRMAEHASELSEYLMKNRGLSAYECDEFWSFVKKKEGIN